jgi:Bacterial Ig domain
MTLSAPFVLSANGSAGINGGETNSWGPAALGSISPAPTAAGLVVTDDSIFNSTGVSISMASPQWKTAAPTTTIATTVDAGNGISTIFEVYIPNCPPVAVDDTYTTTGTAPVTLAPLLGDNDPDNGDVIKIYSINGTPLTPGTAQVIAITGKGVVNIDAAGVIKFTPNTGFVGPANIPYIIQDINGNQANAVEKITVTAAAPLGQLELLKVATLNGTGAVGDTITYKFTVKNTGGVDLTTVTISDTKCSPVAGTLATLAVGATDTTTFSCIYTLTQVDITAGKVENQATVTGKAPNGTDVTDLSDNNNPAQTGPDDITVTLLFPFIQDPSISLDKNSTLQDINGNGYSDLGDKIKYTFVIKNTGNVPLTNISVTDDKCSPLVGATIPVLAVNAIDFSTFSCIYALTQSDLDNGKVINQATVTGTPPNYPNGNPSSPITKKSNDPKTLIPQDATITKLVNYQGSLALIRTGGSSDVLNFKLVNIGILIVIGSLAAMLVRRSLKHPR